MGDRALVGEGMRGRFIKSVPHFWNMLDYTDHHRSDLSLVDGPFRLTSIWMAHAGLRAALCQDAAPPVC